MSQRETVIVQQQSNAFAAFISFFIPGLGHLIQGRILAAIGWWVVMALSVALIFAAGLGVVTTPIVWLWCIVDTAKYNPKPKRVTV